MALATAANSPPQSSADDIFSDTMELASYLHRRVQEIGKQFYHRPFRINTNEKGEFLPGFLQGLPCASKLPLGPSSANFQKPCNPGELRALRKNTENFLQREEGARPPAEEKRFSRPCATSKFSPGLSGCAEMKDCMAVNLYDNFIDEGGVKGCMSERLHDSTPDEARTCYRLQLALKKGEDAQLPPADREELSSEMASGSPCSAPPLKVAHILPSTLRGEQFLVSSGNPTSFVCYTPQLPSKGLGMCDASPKGASDLNFSSFQENENQNISVDAVNCPAMALRLPSVQGHATSNAENAWVLSCMQKGERDCGNPENCASRVFISHNLCHGDLLEGGEGDTVLQVGKYTHNTPSQEVAENPPPPHSPALRCVSSVDSSECDNCGTDAAMGHVVTDRAGLRNSNGTSANNSVEIDAMSEAVCLDTHRKDADADVEADDDQTIVVAMGGETSHKQETKTDALDLLLDAIQVTSGGVFAGKEDADASGPSALPTEEHVLGRNADTSLQERKVSKIFRTNGSSHLDANAPHDIQVNTHKWKTPDFFSGMVHFPIGRFPIVRKRSYRCSKTVIKEEANLVATVVRFKSLQAVSEVNHFNNGKSGKEPAANKQEQGAKALSSKMQEGEETTHHLQSGSNGKRGKDWEKKQESAEKEDQFSKRARHVDADDLQEGRAKVQMLMMPTSEGAEAKGEEEQVGMSRRARSQILPCKFSDSVLQPWKKRDRRKS